MKAKIRTVQYVARDGQRVRELGDTLFDGEVAEGFTAENALEALKRGEAVLVTPDEEKADADAKKAARAKTGSAESK